MIVREPPPSRMKKLRAKIRVRPKTGSPAPDTSANDSEASAAEVLAEEAANEDSLAEALRGTFPASDPPSSWAG